MSWTLFSAWSSPDSTENNKKDNNLPGNSMLKSIKNDMPTIKDSLKDIKKASNSIYDQTYLAYNRISNIEDQICTIKDMQSIKNDLADIRKTQRSIWQQTCTIKNRISGIETQLHMTNKFLEAWLGEMQP